MDSEVLKKLQDPIKDKYNDQPDAARITLIAQGKIGEGITCKVETGKGNAKEVAKFYDQNFIAASKYRSSSFSNDQKFIEWLKGVFAFNNRTGLREMKVQNTTSKSLGKHFNQTTVTWAAILEQKPAEEINFDIHYVLNCSEEDYKIVLYISEEDQ